MGLFGKNRLRGYKTRTAISILGIVILWTVVAFAEVNEDMAKAISCGDLSEVQRLISEGADINAKEQDGATLLMHTSLDGGNEIVREFLTKGADVNAKNEEGWTALMAASWVGYIEVVKELLSKGANIYAKDNNNMTAVMIAAKNEHPDIKDLLINAGAMY